MRWEAAVRSEERAIPDPELQALQEEWSPAWKIWRARRSSDPPGVFAGDFVATRLDDEAGSDRTVMQATAAELDAMLRRQAQGPRHEFTEKDR
jgi:hypothetical protein